MRAVSSIAGVSIVAVLAVGCSAKDRREVATRQPSPVGDRGLVDSQPPASSPDRGALLQTVPTSYETRASMGVVTWAIFKKGTIATMYGFDAQGAVRTQVAASTNPDGTEMRIGAPAAGKLHVRKDGTVIQSTLDPRKIHALSAMRSDVRAAKGEAAYAYCVDPWLDFEDVLDRIGGVYDCVQYDDGSGWCEAPMPLPATCVPTYAPTYGPAPSGGTCNPNCPPGYVFDYPCDCVSTWDDWNGWDDYDW